jgi:hypothetical protein
LSMRSLEDCPFFQFPLVAFQCRVVERRQRAHDSVFRSYSLLGCYLRQRLTTVTSKASLEK